MTINNQRRQGEIGQRAGNWDQSHSVRLWGRRLPSEVPIVEPQRRCELCKCPSFPYFPGILRYENKAREKERKKERMGVKERRKELRTGGREFGEHSFTLCHPHWHSASSQCFRTPVYKPLCTRHWVIFRMLFNHRFTVSMRKE